MSGEVKQGNEGRQSGPGVPPCPPGRLWRSLLIHLCCAAIGVGALLATPPGSGLPHLILRFLTAVAVVGTAQALVLVACRARVKCVGCLRERTAAQMATEHLCARCVEASLRAALPAPDSDA